MPRARRSTRLTGGKTKYTNDPFEAAGVSDESDNGSKRPKGRKEQVSDESSDEEFQANDEQEEEEDDYEGSEEDVAGENDGEEADEEEYASDRGRGAQKAVVSRPRHQKKRLGNDLAMLSKDEMHSRGTHSSMEHMGKMLHMTITFGTDEKDLLSIVYARERWYRGVDSGFPTRASLNEAPDVPDCGFGPTFGVEPEDMKRERTRGWDWYYDGDVGERFRKRQRLEAITEKEVYQKFIPQAKEKKHTVLIGPVDDQKVFTLGHHESFNFGEAFGETKVKAKAKPSTGGKLKGKASAQEDSTGRTRKTREGWVINVGQKVQCMAWAPNQPGLTQYLAVSTPISKGEKEMYADPFKDRGARAFRPSPPYPCALQLWMFKAEREESLTKHIDMNFKPKLRLALCTNWGDLRRMAWCPVRRDPREEDDDDSLKSVGLLAGIWGDGYVRVLDIKLSREPNKAEYFPSLRSEATIDSVYMFNMALSERYRCWLCQRVRRYLEHCAFADSPSNPFPYFYQPIHSTYVLNLASAYPTNAHLITTTSMDGETRLWSVLDPQTDTVESNRMRVGSPYLTYSPLLHSFLSSDENDFARLLAVRRFYTTTAVARFPSTVSSLAPCSVWHPSVMYGCTSGAVVATNPLRRLLHVKEKQWQQTWFTHEWARGDDASDPGISRFHDGYRAESISLLRNMMGDRKMVNGVMMITIYEEGTHVTALSWNPNQACAGWASAGMGCGLIRVEDLAT
ncbi:transcription factor TFIIIC complex subunit Tfc6 [Aspergillus arachidicola]|uniref:Transcription factor TFIIIC complex subunit Tfc6 n=1 Tax=Aspergillus arachidicola TaxID=656916 RepID=A0A2G7FS95_9EURO|nr:transcription factor TFIIIC complex subunit Tfc6 [Aspergillus arachidicola]